MLRVLRRYVPKYGKKSSRKSNKHSKQRSSEGTWSLAEEDSSIHSSFTEDSLPRLHHHLVMHEDSDEQSGLTQQQLDRLGVVRRRDSTCSSDSSSSEDDDDDEDEYVRHNTEDLFNWARPYSLKDIFGEVSESTPEESVESPPEESVEAQPEESVSKPRNSKVEAAAAVTAAAEELRVASLRASETELMNAITEAEEALATLKEKVQSEVAKNTKGKENQPPKRKVNKAKGRSTKGNKSCDAPRASHPKPALQIA